MLSGIPSRQPAKGLICSLISIPWAVGLWYLLTGLYGLDYGPATTVIAICFAFYWQLGWAFGGWPAKLVTDSPWVRGVINWTLTMLLVWGAVELWEWYYDVPFSETAIGAWASTAIIAGVASLFFFGNTLLLPEELAEKQPISGFANFVFAVLFVPLALLLVPRIAGVEGLYITWIWFPLCVVVVGYLATWPFASLGQPRTGVAVSGAVFFLTIVFLAVMDKAGANFFATEGNGALKAAIFGATWTNVALLTAWLFNNWPIGDWTQPLKGVTATLLSLAASGSIYAILMGAYGASDYAAILFGQFAFMWAQVSLAAPGYMNAWGHGYADDPGGAGAGLLGDRAPTPDTVAVDDVPASVS